MEHIHRGETNPCLACGKKLDATGAAHEAKPKVNDLTICLYCGTIMVFASVEPWALRAATPEECEQFLQAPGGPEAYELAMVNRALSEGMFSHRGGAA